MQRAGRVVGDEPVAVVDLLLAHHLGHVQPVEDDVAQVSGAQRVPRVDDVVLPEAHVDAGCGQLLDSRDAAPLGERVRPALQVRVDERVGHEVDAAHREQPQELREVGVVVRVGRRRVAGRHPVPQPHLQRPGGEGLEAAGGLVVDLVAVHVDQEAVLLGQLAREVERVDGVLAGELEVRDRADDVDAHARGPAHECLSVWEGLDALLRERDDLQGDRVLEFLAQLEHRVERGELRIRHVDVGADVLDAEARLLAHGAVHALLHVLDGERGLPLAPHLDALEEGAGLVPAGLTGGEGGIEVDVRLDDGRQREAAGPVDDLLTRQRLQSVRDRGEHPVLDADVAGGLRILDAQVLVEHGLRTPSRGCACGRGG